MKRAITQLRFQFTLVLSIALVILWVLSAYELHRAYQSDLREAELRTEGQAQVMAEYAKSTFKRFNEVAMDLRETWDGDWQAFSQRVRRRQEIIDDLSFQITLVDKDGIVAFSNLAKPNDRTDLNEREHFKVHKNGNNADRLFISRPVRGKVSGKLSIQVTRPLLRDGKFDGIIVISISPQQLASFGEKLKLGPGGVLTVVRDTGEIMARYPGSDSSVGVILANRPFLQKEAPVSGSYRQVATVDGVDRVFGFYRLPELGMTFVVGESVSEVFAPFELQRRNVVLSVAAVTALAMLWYFTLFRSLASHEATRVQLDAILSLSPDGFVSIDRDRRVKYASPAFLKMMGLSPGEVLGADEGEFSERIRRLCDPRNAFPGVATLRSEFVKRQSTEAEGAPAAPVQGKHHQFELQTAGRRVIEYGLRMASSDAGLQVLYFRDVTHEAEVDRMKTEFLSTAAHELRTPMASIYGFSELLLNQKFAEHEVREMLGLIHRQSTLMTSIINELLDLVRIESRQGKDFAIARINAVELLPLAIGNLKVPGGRKPPKLELDVSEAWIRADASKLSQAVVNVLSNAYKYSPEGGEVSVSLRDGAKYQQPGRLGLRIKDTGIGMTPEQVARVFERFYRADTSGTIPGTGLGMSIVKEIVELHDGTVTVESTFGKGTSVTLWIPLA